MAGGELILVVDDNLTNLKLVKVLLVSEGYVLQTATNANEALEILKTFHPQLILMDLQLPGMGGLELTKKLKADQQFQDAIILAITAYSLSGSKEEALAAGCEDYIPKPINIENLLLIIARCLQKKSQSE